MISTIFSSYFAVRTYFQFSLHNFNHVNFYKQTLHLILLLVIVFSEENERGLKTTIHFKFIYEAKDDFGYLSVHEEV